MECTKPDWVLDLIMKPEMNSVVRISMGIVYAEGGVAGGDVWRKEEAL